MKKLFAWLIIVSFIALPVSSFAAGEPLSDAEMDEIAAGDWTMAQNFDVSDYLDEIMAGDSEEEAPDASDQIAEVAGIQADEPADVETIIPGEDQDGRDHFNSNDINLLNESQMNIEAVNNANAVDAATATQANITSVTAGEAITAELKQHNEANLSNYNPSDEYDFSSVAVGGYKTDYTKKMGGELGADLLITKEASLKTWDDKTFDIHEILTWDTDSDFSSQGISKKGGIQQMNWDTDSDMDYRYDNDTVFTSGSDGERKCKLDAGIDVSAYYEKVYNVDVNCRHETAANMRFNKSENNHINLLNTSQKELQVVNNLNAVGSSAAIQANIASDVGVDAKISNTNIVTAMNGM
jgi:hypothetical protein